MRHPEGSVGDERSSVYLWAVSCFLAPGSPFVRGSVRVIGWSFSVALSSFAVCSLASDISCGSGIQYELKPSVVVEGVLPSGSRVARIMCHVCLVSHHIMI